MQYIAYLRVSTKKQGRSSLGLEAQQEIIKHNVKEKEILCWYKDVQSGKNIDILPELQKAIQHTKDEDATLIIAKTDRLRNTQQALNLVDELSPEKVFFCNIGRNADKFTLTLFFAFAEKERLEISIRTKAALARLKAKGVKLGRYTHKNFRTKEQKENIKKWQQAGSVAMREKSREHNLEATNRALSLRLQSLTYKEIANMLNKEGYKTLRGGRWNEATVWRLVQRNLLNSQHDI